MKTLPPSSQILLFTAFYLRETHALASDVWLVSSNPFDVIGAISSGIRAAWVKRTNTTVFDPWDIEPTKTITDLQELTTIESIMNLLPSSPA